QAALEVLPSDWSDLLAELELHSSADIDRAAVLCAPINPIQSAGRPGFGFRCASKQGYGASAGMVGRCLARLDEVGITGHVRITRTLSDDHPVGTQGANFAGERRPAGWQIPPPGRSSSAPGPSPRAPGTKSARSTRPAATPKPTPS